MINEMAVFEAVLHVVAVVSVLAVYGSHLKSKKPLQESVEVVGMNDAIAPVVSSVAAIAPAASNAIVKSNVIETTAVEIIADCIVPFIRPIKRAIAALPALEFYQPKRGEGLRGICRKYGINPRPYVRGGKRKHLSNEAMIAALFQIGVKVAIA